MIVEGRCASGHTFNWESSPSTLMNTHKCKSYVDNLDFASAIILSGNNFTKVSFLSLPCKSKATFHAYQRLFICPTIDRFYKLEQKKILDNFKDNQLILLEMADVTLLERALNFVPIHSLNRRRS